MARQLKVETLENGDVVFRATFPKELWAFITQAGSIHLDEVGARGQPHEIGLRLLFKRLVLLARQGDVIWLQDDVWAQAAAKLYTRAKQDANTLPVDFDRNWLHTDMKRGTGYYGVYTDGPRFEARVRPDSGLGHTKLRGFKTAELAAHARFQYYVRHPALAYGEAELEVENLRKIDPSVATLSDVEIWPQVMNHVNGIGRMHLVFGPGCVSLAPGPREPQLAARKAQSNDAQDRFREFAAGVPALPTSLMASAKGAAYMAPEQDSALSTTVAIGFEDGDLPDCFNGGWDHEPIEDQPSRSQAVEHDLAPAESFSIGKPQPIDPQLAFRPQRVDIEPVRKRGRPRKPCDTCGLALKAITENGRRFHVKDDGGRVACVKNAFRFVQT